MMEERLRGAGSPVHASTVSSLHMNLQVVNFQRCHRAFACPVRLVHVSGIHCHMFASSLIYCTGLYRV